MELIPCNRTISMRGLKDMKCILVCNVAFSLPLVHLRDEASPPRSSGLPSGVVLGTDSDREQTFARRRCVLFQNSQTGDSRSDDDVGGTGNANAVTAESSNSHWGPYIKDWPKSRCRKGSCVNLVLQIKPKFGQGGLRIPKIIWTSNVNSLLCLGSSNRKPG